MFSKTVLAAALSVSVALLSSLEVYAYHNAVIRWFYVPKDYTLDCGSSSYNNGSYILEAPAAIFGEGKKKGKGCGKRLKVFNENGDSAIGEIADLCGPGCGLNLSPKLFAFLAPLKQGRFDGQWEFTDEPLGFHSKGHKNGE